MEIAPPRVSVSSQYIRRSALSRTLTAQDGGHESPYTLQVKISSTRTSSIPTIPMPRAVWSAYAVLDWTGLDWTGLNYPRPSLAGLAIAGPVDRPPTLDHPAARYWTELRCQECYSAWEGASVNGRRLVVALRSIGIPRCRSEKRKKKKIQTTTLRRNCRCQVPTPRTQTHCCTF
ncbi:hypothetical protein C8F01DRAFT_1143835, partial [Mycena amicta]